jgi:glycosyltransferase 2 family protein
MVPARDATFDLGQARARMDPEVPRPADRHPARRLVRPALLALALFALSRLVRGHDLRQALSLIRHVGWPLLLVLLPTLVGMSLDVTGWRLILRALGSRVRWGPLLSLRLSAEAVVLLLPGGSVAGEAAKAAMLTKRTSVSFPTAFASLALTKAYLFATDGVYLALAAVWAAVDTTLLPGHPTHLPAIAAGISALVLTGGSGAFLALLHRASLATRLARALQRVPIARFRRWIAARERGFQEIDATARAFFAAPVSFKTRVFLCFLLEWLVEGAETILIVRCLGLPLPLGPILALDALGSLLRVVAFFVPAGLGVQDAALILLLRQMGVPNPLAAGAAVVLVKRAKEVVWIAIGSLLLMAYQRPGTSGRAK